MINYLTEKPKSEESVEGFIVNGEKYRLEYNALKGIPVYLAKETETVFSGSVPVTSQQGE